MDHRSDFETDGCMVTQGLGQGRDSQRIAPFWGETGPTPPLCAPCFLESRKCELREHQISLRLERGAVKRVEKGGDGCGRNAIGAMGKTSDRRERGRSRTARRRLASEGHFSERCSPERNPTTLLQQGFSGGAMERVARGLASRENVAHIFGRGRGGGGVGWCKNIDTKRLQPASYENGYSRQAMKAATAHRYEMCCSP